MKTVAGMTAILFGVCAILTGVPAAAERSFAGVREFSVPEAVQGVAVDSSHFYAVGSRVIGKYDKLTGARAGRWRAAEDYGIIHLDSGVIVGGRLYAAHSNYPGIPMTSSVEIWDIRTMEHVGSHSFGVFLGSCTWIDRHAGCWWAAFAHYDSFTGQLGKDHTWPVLARLDDCWRLLESWTFPAGVLERFAPMSNSGGSWGPDSLLYVTGHDLPELYVLRLPRAGSVLELVGIVPVDAGGQGIAWDRSESGLLYTIRRGDRKVVASRLSRR